MTSPRDAPPPPGRRDGSPVPRPTTVLSGRAVLWVLGAVALAPALLGILAAARSGWTPSGDNAFQLLQMHDTGTSNTPLVGPYSRFGWRHPGPLLTWLGALPVRLFGPPGVLVTVGAVNVAAAAGAAAAARRLGGDVLCGMAIVATTLLVHHHGVTRLVDPWNPWVAVLPLLCFVLCAAAFAQTGATWTLVAALLAGSLAAQSHLGSAPAVAAGGLGAVVWWWRARPPWTSGRRGLVLVAGGVLLLWSGPLIDQLQGTDGNAWQILSFFAEGSGGPEPLDRALGVAALELGPVPPWLGAQELGFLVIAVAPTWRLAVLPALLLVVGIAGRRAGVRPGGQADRLAWYALWVLAVAVLALTRVSEGFFPYVIRWTWPVAALAASAAAWGTWQLVGVAGSSGATEPVGAEAGADQDPGPRRPCPAAWRLRASRVVGPVLVSAGLVVAVVASGASVRDVASDPIEPVPGSDRAAGAVASAVADALPRGSYRVSWIDVRDFSSVSSGAAANLARDGYDLRFSPNRADKVGDRRVTSSTELPQLVIVGSTAAQTWDPPVGAEPVARWDPRSAAERTELDAAVLRIRRAASWPPDRTLNPSEAFGTGLLDAGADPADVDVLREAAAEPDAYEAWLLPPG